MMNDAFIDKNMPGTMDQNQNPYEVSERPLNIATLPLNVSAMIGASAGTGKTYTITYLVLRLLLGSGGKQGFGRPLSLDELLVVTFTKAAASDLKERIREKIRQARKAFEAKCEDTEPADKPDPALKSLIEEMTSGDDPKGSALKCARLLLRAERGIDDAAISTIHSFANTSLNQIYSFEAGSAFEVELTEEQGLEPINERAHLEIWRELFYHDEPASRALLKLLDAADPSVLGPYEQLLSKVRLPYKAEGVKTVLGFAVKGEAFERFSSLKSQNGLKQALLDYALETHDAEQKIIGDFHAKWESFADALSQCMFDDVLRPDRSTLMEELNPNKAGKKLLKSVFDSLEEPDLEGLAALISGKYESYNSFGEGIFGKRFMGKIAKLPGDDAAFVENCVKACHCIYLYGRRLKELRFEGKLVAGTLAAILVLSRFDALCAAQDKLSMDALLLSLDRALNDARRGDMLAKVLRERYPVAMIDEFQDTDPVQFSIFRKLYLQKGRERTACFLIGDPKQSIYRFRNADIKSYILARSELSAAAGGQGGVYTLDTNYRSSEGVVEGVNCIFKGFPSHAENADPFADAGQPERIGYSRVKTGGGKLHFYWDDDLSREVGNMVYFDARQVLAKNGKPNVQRKYDPEMAEVAAQAVLRCLTHGILVDKAGNSRRVVSSDIAILVSKGKEYELLEPMLKSYGIPCVYYSDKSSVLKNAPDGGFCNNDDPLPSEAARSMLALMEAMNGYFSQGRVLKLMGTPLSCLDAESFTALTTEGDALETETEILRECASCWSEYGFLSAFTLWMKRRRVMQSLLSVKGGERRLTDYLQIAEILQAKHGVLYGAEAQIRYLRDLIEHNGRGVSQDEVRKRLESERSQVKIYTIHKSKGLEFPIVILPFLWGKDNQSSKDSDASLPQVTYSVKAHRRVLVAGDPDGTVAAMEQRELREEQMRLLYVALTRACAANFLCISSESLNANQKALCTELTSCLGIPPMKQADFTALKDLFASAGGHFVCRDYVGTDTELLQLEYGHMRAQDVLRSELAASALQKGSIRRNFTVSSYSAVTSGLHDAATLEQSDTTGDRREMEAPREISGPDGFSFPAGTEPGTFLHTLLQDCDFSRLDDPKFDLKRMLLEEVRRIQGEHLIGEWYRRTAREGKISLDIPASLDEAVEPLHAWFDELTHASLPGLDDFSLSSLKGGDWIPEMDYLVPTAQVPVERINELCIQSADEVFPDHGTLKLNDKKLCGFITGSLDLVFRAPMKGRMRYFVADYKSTLLGRSYEDYSPQAVMASVFDPRNRYDVQYLFYSLALHRFLKSRIRDYSYERDFGGVFYLYLRGMRRGDDGSGIFYTKPSLEILEALERLFDSGEDDGRTM